MQIGELHLWQAADGYKVGEDAEEPNEIRVVYLDDYVVIETERFGFSEEDFEEFVALVREGFRRNRN